MQWNEYFWPGTNVLRNHLNIYDAAELNEFEQQFAYTRGIEVARGQAPIPATCDADHLRGLHRWLFQDVYPFAGEYRDVEITKWSSFAATTAIDSCVNRAAAIIADTNWPDLDDADFADKAAQTYSWINFAHPFREGNGRTVRLFMSAVAAKASRQLDYSAISREVFVQRAAFSCPDMSQTEPAHDWMVPVFEQITRPAGDMTVSTEFQPPVTRFRGYDQGL
ncbi:Fic family protein [Mycolicibacterium sphagni]|uniref:protein adenylyltransferase n=1 Tax=Mycolicibacterium sphagni TaxID=1786 RepID=A0ABX2JZ03_9MYCO|nr:hypothetical protein [Mycolicibacterium sphagni]